METYIIISNIHWNPFQQNHFFTTLFQSGFLCWPSQVLLLVILQWKTLRQSSGTCEPSSSVNTRRSTQTKPVVQRIFTFPSGNTTVNWCSSASPAMRMSNLKTSTSTNRRSLVSSTWTIPRLYNASRPIQLLPNWTAQHTTSKPHLHLLPQTPSTPLPVPPLLLPRAPLILTAECRDASVRAVEHHPPTAERWILWGHSVKAKQCHHMPGSWSMWRSVWTRPHLTKWRNWRRW